MNKETAVKKALKYFERVYNASNIFRLWKVDIKPHLERLPDAAQFCQKENRTPKQEAVHRLRLFLEHESALQIYLNVQSKRERTAFSLLLHYGPMTSHRLNDYLADLDIQPEPFNDIWNFFLLKERFMPISFSRIDYFQQLTSHIPYYHQFFYVTPELRNSLLSLLPEPEFEIPCDQGLRKPPQTPKISVADASQVFDITRGFQLKGGIKYKKNSSLPTKGSAKTLKKMLGGHHQALHAEVDVNDDLHFEELVIATVGRLMEADGFDNTLTFTERLWHQLRSGGQDQSLFQLHTLLPHLKKESYLSSVSHTSFVDASDFFALFTGFFQTLETNRIYSIRDLDALFRKQYPNGKPFENRRWDAFYCYVHADARHLQSRDDPSNAKVNLQEETISELVVHPFMKMICTLTTVWGMADLWTDEVWQNPSSLQTGKNAFLSPYDDVTAWRLNDLGAYVMGQTQRKPKLKTEKQQESVYHLDEDHLVITRTGPASNVDLFLEHLADKIGENRYLVSINSFRKGCNDVFEIQQRQDHFRRELRLDRPPELWQQLFKDCLQRAEPLEKVDGYLLYQVNDHPQLRELFASDSVLRQCTLRAEHHHVLVKPGDLHKVLDVLRKNGFST